MKCYVTIINNFSKSIINRVIMNGKLLNSITKDKIICYMKNNNLTDFYKKYIKKYYEIKYYDTFSTNLLRLNYDKVCYFNNILLNKNIINIFNTDNAYINKNLFVYSKDKNYNKIKDTFTNPIKKYKYNNNLVRFFIPKLTKSYAVVTLLMISDNYLPGILSLAKSIETANKDFRNSIDLICMVTPDISQQAIDDIMKYYDKVIKVDYIEIPFNNIRHSKPHIMKVYAKTFTKLHVFELTEYDKVIMIDCDMLILKPEFFSLFSLNTPAGVFIGCLQPYKTPELMNLYNTTYSKDLKHGHLIKNTLYDYDCYDLYKKYNITKNSYLGVETSICLLKPNKSHYEEMKKILFDSKEKTYKSDTDLIARYFQYKWHHIDIRFLGRWLNPDINKKAIVLDLYGTEGKPWAILYGEYKDSNYWLDRYKEYYKNDFENKCSHHLIHNLYNKLNKKMFTSNNINENKVIYIILVTTSFGLIQDAEIYNKYIPNSVIVRDIKKLLQLEKKSYHVLFLEYLKFKDDDIINVFMNADKKLFMINQELFYSDDKHNQYIDLYLCKTNEAVRCLNAMMDAKMIKHTKIYYTKFTTLKTFYNNNIMNYNSFVHIGGSSPYKNTDLIINTWFENNLPRLNIICYGPCQYKLQSSFLNKPLSQFANKKIFFINVSNADYINGTINNSALISLTDLQMEQYCSNYGVSLCLSRKEGYGHYINQARMGKSLVITINGSPMTELINNTNGYVIPYKTRKQSEWNFSYEYTFDQNDLVKVINEILATPENKILEKVNLAYQNYIDDTNFFINKISKIHKIINSI